jgi:DNA-directed RNA polymerase subunit K/omega
MEAVETLDPPGPLPGAEAESVGPISTETPGEWGPYGASDDEPEDEPEQGSQLQQEEGSPGASGQEGPQEGLESPSEAEDSGEDDALEMQKFDDDLQRSFLQAFHPEARPDNFEQVRELCIIKRNPEGAIDDPRHTTLPFLTKYEMTRVLGLRASQIDHGAQPMTEVPAGIMDGYQIAQQELLEKEIPFILRRPLPDGDFEYWRVADLELILPVVPIGPSRVAV